MAPQVMVVCVCVCVLARWRLKDYVESVACSLKVFFALFLSTPQWLSALIIFDNGPPES